ncbi:MAG TPA: hypothetical protein VL123_05465 [Candidatus Udaeobacter sp.]|jgi:hypothetical protein|nr:hypothetical protein [Candidatus Udaeobacter sp.]
MTRAAVVAVVALPLLFPFHSALAAPADSARVEELERKVDALTEELDRIRFEGAAADSHASRPGSGATRVSGLTREGVSIGGYGEMTLNAFDRRRQDRALANLSNRVDLVRAVLYVGYRFTDQILFDSELEWESAGVLDEAAVEVDSAGAGTAELSGEASVEFAHLDWTPSDAFGVRAGKLLVPVGLTNEMHEPPIVIGALRPDAETRVIPSTWSEAGAGVFGRLASGFSYRAYVMEGLDGQHFSAETAIREGRQGGSNALATRPAGVVRLEYAGPHAITFGASYYAGHAWQREQPAGMRLDPVVRLSEIDARLRSRGLDARALYVRGTLSQSSDLSDQLGLTGPKRLGDAFFGGYVEARYDVLPAFRRGSSAALLPYARYEESDTQDGVALPGSEDPEHHGTALTLGLAFEPVSRIALKAERQIRRNETHTGTNQWNLAMGWMY